MLPLPLAVSGLRVAIAEKLLLIWLSENRSPDELLLAGGRESEVPLQLQQAARIRAAQPANAIRVPLLVTKRIFPSIA
jgi:hypothetical protein